MQIDVHVLELLASKFCHDLVSPVSAINNGVELIEDIGGSVVDEAMKLIGDSAVHAARRLRLFRLAYGRAGGEDSLAVRDIKQVAEQYLSTGKVTLTWTEGQPVEALAAHKGALKIMLNMLIMAEESLAYGGTVSLHAVTEGIGCRFEIRGRNAQLSPALQAALEGSVPVEELTPRSIQSYVTGKFAAHFGLKLIHQQPAADHLDLVLSIAEAVAPT